MARRSSRQDRKRREARRRLWNTVTLIAVPVLLLGGGGVGLYEYMNIEQADATFCYDRAEQAKTAVFLDRSVDQNLSGAQFRDLNTALERAYDEAPVNGKIMIFTTARDSGGSLAKPVFSICRPAETAAEQTSIGAPSKTAPNLRHTTDEARAKFNAEVRRIMSEAAGGANSAQESPILSQVQAISRYRGFQGQNRTLFALTDGLESSETARFGQIAGEMPSFAKFAKQDRYGFVKPDSFAGADVTLLLVESITLPQPGLDHVTHDEVRRWWPEYFKANGADSVRLERLRRVNGS